MSDSDNLLVELEDGRLLVDIDKENGLYRINRLEPKWDEYSVSYSRQPRSECLVQVKKI